MDWISISEKLPEVGQRVKTMVIKEMTYMGDKQEASSMWKDDGEGKRAIICWKNIEENDGW